MELEEEARLWYFQTFASLPNLLLGSPEVLLLVVSVIYHQEIQL